MLPKWVLWFEYPLLFCNIKEKEFWQCKTPSNSQLFTRWKIKTNNNNNKSLPNKTQYGYILSWFCIIIPSSSSICKRGTKEKRMDNTKIIQVYIFIMLLLGRRTPTTTSTTSTIQKKFVIMGHGNNKRNKVHSKV